MKRVNGTVFIMFWQLTDYLERLTMQQKHIGTIPYALNSAEMPVRVGRIEYLNVAPVYYGFDKGFETGGIQFIDGTPAQLNRCMAEDSVDISPVSAFAYAKHQKDWCLLPDLSISCFGPVMSVLLVSRFPFEQLSGRHILMTDASASGAALLKLLFARNGIIPDFETGKIDGASQSGCPADGFLVIGNAALKNGWPGEFRYIYDLGAVWRRMTGLPFVFAVWAVRRQFAETHPAVVADIAGRFLRSREMGMRGVPEICRQYAGVMGMDFDVLNCYFERLRYDLDPFKRLGIQSFFNHLLDQGILDRKVRLSFFNNLDNVLYLRDFGTRYRSEAAYRRRAGKHMPVKAAR